MELNLRRIYRGTRYTIGRLSIDGKYYCDILEPSTTKPNAHGKVAIPDGRYEVIITDSPRFGVPLPLLLGVPNREGIRMHAGNDESATDGCLLPGENREKGRVSYSQYHLKIVQAKVQQGLAAGKVYITVS